VAKLIQKPSLLDRKWLSLLFFSALELQAHHQSQWRMSSLIKNTLSPQRLFLILAFDTGAADLEMHRQWLVI